MTDRPTPTAPDTPTQEETTTMGETPPTLDAALVALQAKLPHIRKTETADVKTDKGRYSYTYADLADITHQLMPLLAEVGLAFTAKPTLNPAGHFVLSYSLRHAPSGEREDGEWPLPDKVAAQVQGSAITYYRRYALCAITGVAPDDDDDGAAANTPGAAPSASAAKATEQFAADKRALIAEATDRDTLNAIWKQVVDAEKNGMPAHLITQLKQEMTDRARQIVAAENQDGTTGEAYQ